MKNNWDYLFFLGISFSILEAAYQYREKAKENKKQGDSNKYNLGAFVTVLIGAIIRFSWL